MSQGRVLLGISLFWLALSMVFDGINTLVLPRHLLGQVDEASKATVLGLVSFVSVVAGMLAQSAPARANPVVEGAPPAGPAIVSAGCRSCCRARCSAWWAHAATTRATSCCPTASWPRSSPRVLNTPVHCCFDEQGSCCVVECGHKIEARPRILRVDVSTDTCQTFFEWPAERWSKTGAVTGACWHQGALYVANTDTLSRIGPDGRLADLVTGLPGKGDHQTNHPVVGPDGKLYWGRGSATNTGVVGADNFPCEWLPIYADARRTIRQAWLARSSLRPGYSQAWVPPRRSSKKYWSGKGEAV